MCSEVYTRSCSLHDYSTWSCIDWLLGDRLPGQRDSYFKHDMQYCSFV